MNEAKKLDHILLVACINQDVSIESAKSKLRLRELVDARYIFYYISKKLTIHTLEKIGSTVNRDHATVLHGLKEVEDKKFLKEAADNIINKYFN